MGSSVFDSVFIYTVFLHVYDVIYGSLFCRFLYFPARENNLITF